MTYDYIASLANQNPDQTCSTPDELLVYSCVGKNEKIKARNRYMELAPKFDNDFPKGLCFEPNLSDLPKPAWLGIEISFILKSPWYSKDDRPFHVLDNPVRRDRLLGKPFMSASSWKGLLRWACRMKAGLLEHLENRNMRMDGWEDEEWILHLFGNEKGEKKAFRSGTLIFFPTWFDEIGFELINPHSRTRRAGTQPIHYEVVPSGARGKLQLLYAPMPGEILRDNEKLENTIHCLFESIKKLLETYGFSAKRTVGWGTASIDDNESNVFFVKGGSIDQLFGEGQKVSLKHENGDTPLLETIYLSFNECIKILRNRLQKEKEVAND